MSITIERPAITHPVSVCQNRTPNSSECAADVGGGVATASTDNVATPGAAVADEPGGQRVEDRAALVVGRAQGDRDTGDVDDSVRHEPRRVVAGFRSGTEPVPPFRARSRLR